MRKSLQLVQQYLPLLKTFLFYNFTAGEDPMAEMLARIKSGNVHLKKIEAATSVRQLSLQQCVYLFFITGKEEA